MTAYAASIGHKVSRFYVEAESGGYEKIERRDQMRALLKDAKPGDLILVDKLDRWSRDAEFSYRTMRELREKGISAYFVSEQIDPSTPHGDSMLGMRIYFAHEERKRIRERMVGGRESLRDRGLYAEGPTPMGYKRQAVKGPDKNLLIVDEHEAEIVRRMFKLCIQGHSIREIAEALDLQSDRVVDALHRRLYIGQIKDGEGRWIKGKHPVLIDARTFAEVQQALKARQNGRPPPKDGGRTADWILRDVARCGRCDAKMASGYGPQRKNGQLFYYTCGRKCQNRGPQRNTGAYVQVRAVEAEADMLLMDRLVELKDELGRPPAPVKGPPVDLRERRAKLEKKRERALETYNDGLSTKDELRAALARIDAERLKLDALETSPPMPSAEHRRAELRLVGELIHRWLTLGPKEKRQIVNRLAVSVRLIAGHVPDPVWRDSGEIDLSEVAKTLLTRGDELLERPDLPVARDRRTSGARRG